MLSNSYVYVKYSYIYVKYMDTDKSMMREEGVGEVEDSKEGINREDQKGLYFG